MKRFIIIALAVVLVATGGVFAYTFTTATATIGVTAVESDFAAMAANTTYSAQQVLGKFTGTWSAGTLFDITPDPNYTGDLVVSVYLVNSGALIRQYHHLNMALEFQDSTNVAADEQGEAQVLNLNNAAVLFTWASGNGTTPYYVKLTGGSYRMHPWKSLTGGSVAPQLWCEVTQR